MTLGQAESDGAISAGLTGLVVAGDEAGWIVDQDGVVWRISPDGTAAQTDLEIPTYNSGFSTFVDGTVVFGGTRCDGEVSGEACNGETVVEMRLLNEGDLSLDTVELFREDGGSYRSVGAGVRGVADGAVWVYRDTGELSAVDADGNVTELAIPTGADSPRAECMVDGELFGIRDDVAAADDFASDVAPTPTIYEPGTQATNRWVVDRWDGNAWVPVENGAHTTEGPDVSITCISQGYVIHLRSPHTPVAEWSPAEGWQQPGARTAPLDLNSLLMSTTKSLYTVSDGTLQRVDLPADSFAATAVTEAAVGTAEGEQPSSIDIVDDAGALLIACTSLGRDAGRCVVTPDE